MKRRRQQGNAYREGKLVHDDPERTMRGLECRTRECTDSRRTLRDNAMAAVLNEQYEQQVRSCDNKTTFRDPQEIADLYHSVSWKSQYTAYTQGMADEQDALEHDTETTSLFFGLGSVTTPASTSKRNSVLSSIISIDRNEPAPLEDQETTSIAGFNSDLWASAATTTTETASFNLNSFFKDMSMGIAVGAA